MGSKCTLIAVEGDGPHLVGRDWLRRFRLDRHRIQNAQVSDSLNRELDILLTRFAEVFGKSKGPILPYLAKLQLKVQSKASILPSKVYAICLEGRNRGTVRPIRKGLRGKKCNI